MYIFFHKHYMGYPLYFYCMILFVHLVEIMPSPSKANLLSQSESLWPLPFNLPILPGPIQCTAKLRAVGLCLSLLQSPATAHAASSWRPYIDTLLFLLLPLETFVNYLLKSLVSKYSKILSMPMMQKLNKH